MLHYARPYAGIHGTAVPPERQARMTQVVRTPSQRRSQSGRCQDVFPSPPPDVLVTDRHEPVAPLTAEQPTVLGRPEPLDMRPQDGHQLRRGRNRTLHPLGPSLEAPRLVKPAVVRPLLTGRRTRPAQEEPPPSGCRKFAVPQPEVHRLRGPQASEVQAGEEPEEVPAHPRRHDRNRRDQHPRLVRVALRVARPNPSPVALPKILRKSGYGHSDRLRRCGNPGKFWAVQPFPDRVAAVPGSDQGDKASGERVRGG